MKECGISSKGDECDFCGAKADEPIAALLDEVIDHIAVCVGHHYDDPVNGFRMKALKEAIRARPILRMKYWKRWGWTFATTGMAVFVTRYAVECQPIYGVTPSVLP